MKLLSRFDPERLKLIARIARRSPGEFSPDASLAQDLNLSSLERVELMSAIEDRYQVELNEAKFTLATTVRDLEKMLHQPAAEGPRFHYPRWPQRDAPRAFPNGFVADPPHRY